MIHYADTLDNVSAEHLRGGFFEGWTDPPSPETHLRLLEGSDEVVLALDGPGVLGAHVPLLEVLPGQRGRGIGSELVCRMLARLDDLYMVDLLCGPEVRPFYASLGMQPASGMMVRRYTNQSGTNPSGAIY